MAVHKLDSKRYKELDYSGWDSIKSPTLASICSDLYPKPIRVTSISENRDFSWFFGYVQINGPGIVQVEYPYRESHEDSFQVRNINFSYFPYLLLRACPLENATFKGWKGLELDNSDFQLIIGENDYPDTTLFVANFESDEDSMGV